MTKIDCTKCVNRCRSVPGAQESYCSHCIHGAPWRVDHYDEGPVGGVPNNNCDGCARGLPVVDGLHRDNGRASMACTANRYKGE